MCITDDTNKSKSYQESSNMDKEPLNPGDVIQFIRPVGFEGLATAMVLSTDPLKEPMLTLSD